MTDEPRFTKAEILVLLQQLRVNVEFHDDEDGGYVAVERYWLGDYVRWADVLNILFDSKQAP